MPHKHKRKRGDDESEFNLPPSQKARPLQVGKKNAAPKPGAPKNSKAAKEAPTETKAKKSKKARKENDAPRAFRRIMAVAQGKKFRSGLDDGDDGKTAKQKAEELKIRPGEDLRAFAQRVDASLPVAGLTKKTVIKDGKDEQGFKVYRTRKERNMHKLYAQWREEERKIQEQKEEAADEAIGKELDEDPTGAAAIARATLNEVTGKRARRKGGKVDDPWEELKKKRAEAKIAVHDQAQAPPELNKNMSKHIKIKDASANVGDIPKAAGSLKRREELQQTRADVLEAYRKIREHEQAKLLRAGQ